MTTHDTLGKACVNGTPAEPAPTVVTKEVDMAVAGPVLLAKPDYSKNRGGQGIHVQHCCSCYGLLETDNQSQEKSIEVKKS